MIHSRGLSRVLSAVMLLLSVVSLSGCWDRKEIESLAFVTALGIDRGPNGGKYTLTDNIALPRQLRAGGEGMGGGGGRAGGGAPRWIVTGTGDTIAEAARSMQESSSRRLFAAHIQLVVIGEDLARQGILPVLEYFGRTRAFRRTLGLAVAEGNAQAVLETAPELERLVALTYRGIRQWSPLVATSSTQNLHLTFDSLSSEGQELVLVRILPTTAVEPAEPPHAAAPTEFPGVGASEAVRGMEKQKQNRQDQQSQAGAQQAPQERTGPESEVLVAGEAVFKGDKLVGWLNRRETRGYLLIRNEPFRGIVTVMDTGDRRVRVSLESGGVDTSIKVSMRRGRPELQLKVRWQGDVSEVMGTLDITRHGSVEHLQRLAAVALANDIRAALKKAQKELKSDIFAFGEEVRRAHPREWQRLKRDWNKIYPEVKVTIQVEAKIRRVGVVTKPLAMR